MIKNFEKERLKFYHRPLSSSLCFQNFYHLFFLQKHNKRQNNNTLLIEGNSDITCLDITLTQKFKTMD